MQSRAHTSALEPIEVHIRNYRTLLKSAGFVKINHLIESHLGMRSILHEKGESPEPDYAALTYAFLRLPRCISQTKTIVLGQSYTVFKKHNFGEIDSWKAVDTPGRRRKMFFNGEDTLGVYIGSVTDVDDVITLLTAFTIEWNKLHRLSLENHDQFIHLLHSPESEKIRAVLGDEFSLFIQEIETTQLDFVVKLLSGSYVEYMRSTQYWWNHISEELKTVGILDRPVYFVSSNMHSLTNVIAKTALSFKDQLLDKLMQSPDEALINFHQSLDENSPQNEYFLHYLAKKYNRFIPNFSEKKRADEQLLGIHSVSAFHYLDINVQVIELNKLAQTTVSGLDMSLLKDSSAVIINIDYPLGWAAYQVLTEIAQNVDALRGIYVMGKSATLTGNIGDILLPETIFDQHTKNTYIFNNCLKPELFDTFYTTGTVFAQQKAITVKGTFFENESLISQWHQQGFTDIEMEAGPFFNGIYECMYYNRYVENQFVSLLHAPFEVGVAHYASDTPHSKAKNLGVRNLSFDGIESTYAISDVIFHKIVQNELKKLS